MAKHDENALVWLRQQALRSHAIILAYVMMKQRYVINGIALNFIDASS